MSDPSTTSAPTTTWQSYSAEVNGGQTTSYLAVTATDFKPSAGCETAFWKMAPPSLVAWDPGYNLYNPKGTKCHPTPVTTWWDDEHVRTDGEARAKTTISLGPIVCPSPYTTAATSVNAQSRTLVGCCPSGFTFTAFEPVGMTGQCESKIKAGDVFTYIYYTKPAASSSATTAQGTWVTTTSTATTTSSAFAIPINGWLFPTTSSSTSGLPVQTGSAEKETAAQAANSGTGLSSAAKIGIAVGVSLAAAIIAGGVFAYFFIKRRRERRSAAWLVAGHSELAGPHSGKTAPASSATSSEYTSLSPADQWGGSGLGIGPYRDQSSPVQLQTPLPPAELQGQRTPPMELHGSSNMMAVPRAELPENISYQRDEVEPKVLHPGYS